MRLNPYLVHVCEELDFLRIDICDIISDARSSLNSFAEHLVVRIEHHITEILVL